MHEQGNLPEPIRPAPRQSDANFDIDELLDGFERAGHDDGRGDKCWYARDLAVLLGYIRWESFPAVLAKAKSAAIGSGIAVDDHFRDVPKMMQIGKGGQRAGEDMSLSRYAAYLVAQNADPRKRQVAIAQTYFAIQARRQELADREGPDFSALSEQQQRLYLRNQVMAENKRLNGAAQAAGVKSSADFGKFHNKGYQGLYGGRGVNEIKRHKRLSSKANILDHMGSTELAANLFRITQTEEKLRSKDIRGKEAACSAHYEVGKKVRQTMKELSGIMPEDLPVAEDVKKLAAKERKSQKTLAPAVALQDERVGRAPVEIDLRRDLWKYVLLVMSVRPAGEITTADLIGELPNFIHISDAHAAINQSRKDSKFSQIVRNLKSHKTSSTNFIFQGFAEDIKGGFRITERGMAFVKEYFQDQA